MEMVKLKKDDRVIERKKVDFENNKDIWARRGWSLDDGKPAKPEPKPCLLYTSPSPRDQEASRMPSSA